MTWGRAFRAAGAYLGWSIVWLIVGGTFALAGLATIVGSIAYSSYSYFGGTNYSWGRLIAGAILILIGYLIAGLGLMAAFFKINSEVVSEEVRKQTGVQTQTN